MNIKKIVGILLHGVWYLWLALLNFAAAYGAFLLTFVLVRMPKIIDLGEIHYAVSYILMVMYSDYMLIEKITSKIPRPHLKQLLVFYTVVLIPLISFLVVNGYFNQTLWERKVLAIPLFIGGILYLGLVTYVKEKLKLKEKQAYALASSAKEETND